MAGQDRPSTDEDDGRESSSGIDRRRFERFDTLISVDYSSGDTFLFSYIQNISEMGIFIRSDAPLPIGTVLSLRFSPDGQEAMEVAGEVAWVNPVLAFGENLNPGMGVRFRDLNPDLRERVVSLVRTVAYLRPHEN
jgi:type IV pilus assembly protein PilZ